MEEENMIEETTLEENEKVEEAKEVTPDVIEDTSLSEKKNGDNPADSKKIFKRYTVKDVVFIVVASVAMLITCIDMPFIASLGFGIGMLGIGFQVSFFQAVILAKVRKPGASLISAFLLGMFHVVFAPQMILFSLIGGLVGETLGLLIFRGYKSYLSIGFTSSFLVPVIALFTIAWYFMLNMGNPAEAMNHLMLTDAGVIIPVVTILGVVALSVAGAVCGTLLMRTLYKKGVIHESI